MSQAGPSSRAHALVLCAGLGTRLGRLSLEIPKPLLPVGDRPQLEHVLLALGSQGFTRVLVNTHHLPESFTAVRSDNLELAFSHEPELRGTAGAVGFARERLGAPLVVWNGDILAEPALAPLCERAEQHGICLLARRPEPGTAGTLGLDQEGRTVRLRGERFGDEHEPADYVGILALGPELVAAAPQFGCLIGDVCLPWLRSGRAVPTLRYDGPWTDIGSVAAYHLVNLAWLEARSLEAFVANGADVSGNVTLRASLVHGGASVTGHGTLDRCVVLPGARAVAPLADAIVLASGAVVPVGDGPTVA